MMMCGKMKTFDEKLAAAVPLSPIVCDRCWVTDSIFEWHPIKRNSLLSLSSTPHTHSANNNRHTQKVVLVAMNNSCPRPNFLSSTQPAGSVIYFYCVILYPIVVYSALLFFSFVIYRRTSFFSWNERGLLRGVMISIHGRPPLYSLTAQRSFYYTDNQTQE